MTTLRKRAMQGLLLALAVAPLTGCLLAVDVFDPGLWTQLGIDPATIYRPPGTIIIAFNNQTQYAAEFRAFTLTDLNDITRGSRNLVTAVDPNEVVNEVLDCPIGLISPGGLAADFSIDVVGALVAVVSEEGAEMMTVEYDTPALSLRSGESYSCGDVIEIRLESSISEGELVFLLQMSVIPGSQATATGGY